MNGSLSDGNENIIDIFVLSTSTTESPVQAGYLETLGYRTTFFSDGKQLFESLRNGKPNLLICDSVLLHEEAYDLCRLLKADYDLWVVPVLIVTRASNLADLLHVLDCNADNFISYPYDPSYLSALIEGMLSTPVERQNPEQVKTQFKIQHDEQMFVVTADRRKLLEFLLSSFEIAVNRSGDISRLDNEIEKQSEDLKQTEDRVRDQARSIENLNTALRQKDLTISTLIADAREKDRRIRENGEEIQRLQEEVESGKIRTAGDTEQIQRLTREAEDLTHRYTEETGDLEQQVSMLSKNLATTEADLKAVKESLDNEISKRTDTETRLSAINDQKEQAEKTVRALTLECEQVRVSLAAEKNRAQSAEYEIKSLFQAKNETEQNLTSVINELKETAKHQGTDLIRQKEELDNGKNRIISLENLLVDLQTEKERTETELHARTGTYEKTTGDLRTQLDQARAALAEKGCEAESLQGVIREIREEKDKTVRDLHSRLEELMTVRSSLAEEKEQHRATEQKLIGEIRERDALLQELQGKHQTVRTDFEEHKNTLTQVRSDLEAVITARSDLEKSLDSATARVRELESELRQVSSAEVEAQRQVRTLTDEREQAKAELENNRRLHHSTEEALEREKLEKERILSNLQNMSREWESLQSAIAKEKQLKSEAESERERLLALLSSAESEGKNKEASSSATIHELTSELESSRALLRDLEDQITTLSRERQQAEEKASSLSAEIDQARTALADEWEDHMNAQERLVVVVHEKQQLEQSLHRSAEPEPGVVLKRALMVKGPDLPMDIGKRAHGLNTVPTGDLPESPAPRITNVEDLFEKDETSGPVESEDLPSVSIIHEPSADGVEAGLSDNSSDTGTGSGMETSDPESEELVSGNGTESDVGPEAENREGQSSGEFTGGDISPGTAFSRAQWFDLLKWAHHSGALSQEQRMQIVRMGRLIQKGRKLTNKQEEQVREMIRLVHTLGYRFA